MFNDNGLKLNSWTSVLPDFLQKEYLSTYSLYFAKKISPLENVIRIPEVTLH